MKKIKMLICSLLMMIMGITMSSCIVDQPKENFNTFTNSVFQTLVGSDEFTSNFLFTNPENFGLGRYEPSLPVPGKTQALGLIILNLYLGQINGFNYDELNDDEKMTYNIINNLLDKINAQSSEMSYLSNDYLGSYLGYQAQLPLLLTEYKFKDKLDVDNYFKYLDLIPATFQKYYEFEVEKADNGYGMPDFVIDKVVSQCENFIANVSLGTEHFMIKVVDDKIDGCSFLSDSEKSYYKDLNYQKVNGPLIEGYAYVKEHLPSLKGKATNNMGLAHYVKEDGTTIGRDYYEIAFKDAVGYDISLPNAISYIEGKLAKYEEEKAYFKNISLADNTFIERVKATKLMSGTPESQLNLYQTIIAEDFPNLELDGQLDISIKYIDESMQDNFSPAAYMTSPIDDFTSEFIYLNPKSIMETVTNPDGSTSEVYDYNYLFTTLAHEGFPGHLYQNVYFKNQDVNNIRKVLKSSGTMEGWATYAEMYMYKLLEGYDQDIIDYLVFQEEYSMAIYSRLDMGIHYNGWTLEETHDYMSKYYNITIEQTKETYQRLIEVPNNCQYYYFTYFKLTDMYDDIVALTGDAFDPVTFHKHILDCGPAPLRFVEEYVRSKYAK